MKVIYTKNELISTVKGLKNEGKIIGLVPTMGALHSGHLSLVQKCHENCDICVVSIFVNPTQFNDSEDLKRYPRTPEKDTQLLEKAGCDIVFMPSITEIYPEKDTRHFNFGHIEQVMEGARRPGHFNGVGQIVSKLFYIVEPHKAFFGMKDFQQIAIIKNMVKQLNINVEIIPCPIIREESGLALSSRNTLLTPEHKAAAPQIFATLKEAKKTYKNMSVNELKQWISDHIDSNPLLKTEYVEIVDDTNLEIISNWNEKNVKVICVAVHAGEIRLIDNIVL